MEQDKRMWGGRFEETTDEAVAAFTASVDVDQALALVDIQGSIAHAKMLGAQKILTAEEARRIVEGLEALAVDIQEGRFEWRTALEDVHMNIEQALTDRIGALGGKLHTARSRNDQVATALRLWLGQAVRSTVSALKDLCAALVDAAESHLDVVMPGYTHLQVAQPVLLAHHLLAYYEMLRRDARRFSGSLERISVSPLGAGALAGTSFPIDRHQTASMLGFADVARNSIDAVASRDHVLEHLSYCAITMVHLSRLSEELILWSSQEFGFVTLPDSHTTGSSIMPQKKNPDVCELVRGKTGSVCGHLMAQLMMMKGLPLAYNRDMQEDKAGLFAAHQTLLRSLRLYATMLPKVQIHAHRMREAAGRAYSNATDLADYLARKGMPFREAHEVTGKLVALCLKEGVPLESLPITRMKALCPTIGADVYDHLAVDKVVDARQSFGGTARSQVALQIRHACADLKDRWCR